MLLVTLALIIPLSSACTARRDVVAVQPVSSPTALTSPAPTNLAADTPAATITSTGTSTDTITSTGTLTGTPEALPTPLGTPPAPIDALNIFRSIPFDQTLVKRDIIQLDAPGPTEGESEVLITITGPGEVLTREIGSRLGVLSYNSRTRQWNLGWTSEVVSGTASPLLGVSQKDIGGYNGGDLLRTGDPILAVRTSLDDGRARLHLWRWNKQLRTAAPIKKSGGPPAGSDTIFEADLDINLMDIDGDGVYEVVGDNRAGVQVWKWDGNVYAPQEVR